ncbi:MAG: zinc dependent phospholipase C family protein [Pirellulales bacterium]
MQSIITILRAAHCRSTHHYFAIDALEALQTAQSKRLASILLKFHDDYLEGAKAPDNDFKDFQNHVIHVQQNNWGGAALACQEWLGKAREYLDHGNWKKAAYACGVLSHYFTDPIMPLHTAQSSRETVVHRPLEWSICQSYNEIYSRAKSQGLTCDIVLAADLQWIGKAVVAAAAVANRHYDRLIDLYDLKAGVKNPREGLNDEAVEILSELFVLAIQGLSAVLTRLADETVAQLPQMSLTMTSLLATVDMPLAWIVRKISDSKERRAVEAVLREYEKTGSLNRNVPAEIVVVEKAMKEQPDLRMQFGANVSTDKLLASVSIVADESSHDSTEERGSSSVAMNSRKLVSVMIPQEQPVTSAAVPLPRPIRQAKLQVRLAQKLQKKMGTKIHTIPAQSSQRPTWRRNQIQASHSL